MLHTAPSGWDASAADADPGKGKFEVKHGLRCTEPFSDLHLDMTLKGCARMCIRDPQCHAFTQRSTGTGINTGCTLHADLTRCRPDDDAYMTGMLGLCHN